MNEQPVDGRLCTAKHQLVVQTYVVHRGKSEIVYEVHLAPDLDRNAQRTVLITENEDVYKLALKLEGNTAARVTATFHHAKRGSYRFRVLDTLVVGAS